MNVNRYDAITAIERIAQKYRVELEEEDLTQDDNSEFQEEEEITTDLDNVYSLSELPFAQMDQLKVSKISIFEDVVWDWRQEGSPLYKDKCFCSWNNEFSEGVSLLDKENQYLCRLLKMIAFYSLPQNACLQNIRSFNSSKSFSGSLKRYLGKFLYDNRLFIDIQGNGSFNNAIYLREEHFTDFLKNIDNAHLKNVFAKQVKNWRGLSQNKLIPVEYRLDFDPFSKDVYSKLSRDEENNKGTFLPISLDTLSKLVPYSINMIEEYSEEVLKIYNTLIPIIAGGEVLKANPFEWNTAIEDLSNINSKLLDLRTFRFTDYNEIQINHDQAAKIRTAIRNHPEWHIENPLYVSNLFHANRPYLKEVASKLNINLEEIDRLIGYDLTKIRNEALSLIVELRNSCVTILFLVTGMRNSEMYLLEAGDCWRVKGSDDDYRIKITVSKTSDGSSGDTVILPIPLIAFKAFKCLESLTEKARIWGETNRLMVDIKTRFGNEIRASSIGVFFKSWCEDLEIDHIHTHQFRKTIAMFAIYQNPNNISIIRRLFSHKSLAMTLAYIIKLPGMAQEIRLAVIEQNKSLLAELLEAIEKNCIAGKGGTRIKELIQESKIFKASLHEDGWEPYEQYVEILLQDGLNILHRTSFAAICTNTHSGLVHLGPESCSCNVLDCDWAAFTETSIEELETDIKFHLDKLAKVHSEDQDKFSRYIIRNCIERLIELKGWDAVNSQYPQLVNMGA